jgi:hypothetical protein
MHGIPPRRNLPNTDNEGNRTQGEAAWASNHLEQEFQLVWPKGTSQTFRSTMVRTGPDDYDWNVQHRDKEGEWVDMFGLEYKRQPA